MNWTTGASGSEDDIGAELLSPKGVESTNKAKQH